MVNFKEDERLNKLNHSCAHLMAQAVKHLFSEAKFWVQCPASVPLRLLPVRQGTCRCP